MEPTRHGFHLAFLSALALAAGVGFWLEVSFLAPADEATLEEHLGTVRSAASEAVFLIDRDRAGWVPAPYLHSKMEVLARSASRAGASLAGARPKPRLRGAFRQASRLATLASATLERISAKRPSTGAKTEARTTLAGIRAQAQALEEEEKR